MIMKTDEMAIRARVLDALGWWHRVTMGQPAVDRLVAQVQRERDDAWLQGRNHQRGIMSGLTPGRR